MRVIKVLAAGEQSDRARCVMHPDFSNLDVPLVVHRAAGPRGLAYTAGKDALGAVGVNNPCDTNAADNAVGNAVCAATSGE
jgi:hypothetical protein